MGKGTVPHAIYCKERGGTLKALLARCGNKPILTVSDIAGFAEKGG